MNDDFFENMTIFSSNLKQTGTDLVHTLCRQNLKFRNFVDREKGALTKITLFISLNS